MKSLVLLLLAFLFLTCDQSELPTLAEPTQPMTFDIADYGTVLDSSYFKVWSDSSWEAYGGIVEISGERYFVLQTSDSVQYFYNSIGFAGFQPKNDQPIIFDQAIEPIFGRWTIGREEKRSTTFMYQHYQYTYKIYYILRDTNSVTTRFGTFYSCLHFENGLTLQAAGLSETQVGDDWLAKGPGTIATGKANQINRKMVRGYVNGKSWGSSISQLINAGNSNVSRLEISQGKGLVSRVYPGPWPAPPIVTHVE